MTKSSRRQESFLAESVCHRVTRKLHAVYLLDHHYYALATQTKGCRAAGTCRRAAMKTGLWLLDRQADGSWAKTNFDANSSGFEHATYAADLDGDGNLELYVAADEQRQLNRYTWDAATSTFQKETLGSLSQDVLTWNITSMTL